MSLGTLGTTTTTILPAFVFNPPPAGSATTGTLSQADLAQIANSITGDAHFAATNPTGIIATATTAGTTTLTALAYTAGGALSTIHVGALVLGSSADVAPGTFVTSIVSGTSVTISRQAISTGTLKKLAFVNQADMGVGARLDYQGILELPGGRGRIIVKPGDVVAIDSTGWPIVVSAASIAYTGTVWAKA